MSLIDKAHDKERLAAALLLACLRARVTESAEGLTPELLADVDWDSFLRLAIRHRVVPAVRHVLEPLAGAIPRQSWENIRDAALSFAAANERWMNELEHLLLGLKKNGVPCLALRGLPLSQQLYGNIHSRQVSDIDLLVHPADAARSMAVISTMGWMPMFRLDAVQTQAFIRFRTERAFMRHAEHLTVDLHWRSMPPAFSLVSDEALWREAQAPVSDHVRGPALRTAHLLLHLCAHGNKHGWNRFAYVLDLAMALRRSGPADLAEALAIAEAAGKREAFVFGLILCRDLACVEVPDEACASSRAGEGIRRVQRFLLDPCSVWGRLGQERPLLRYMLERGRDRARYYADVMLTPTGIEIEKISLPRPLWFLYYFVRLGRLAIKAVRRTRAL